ncbi:MAG TPA: hypothetical protein VGD71_23170 [Kribbella sp.]
MHVVIQPAAGFGAEVIEPLPGVRQLIAGHDQVGLTIQVPARIGGLADTARFARSLAVAAGEFAAWCDEQNRNRTFGERHEGWAGLGVHTSTDEEK